MNDPNPANNSTLLIGIGNEYRQDDGVGIHVARKIASQKIDTLQVIENQRDGMALIEKWKGHNKVICVDTVVSDTDAGHIHRLRVPEDELPKNLFNCSTHTLSVAEAVEMARNLDVLPPQMIIYGIEGKCFDNGTGLSEAVKKSAQKVTEEILKDLSSNT